MIGTGVGAEYTVVPARDYVLPTAENNASVSVGVQMVDIGNGPDY